MQSMSSRGLIVYTIYIIWIKKLIWHFQNHNTPVTIFSLENVLSPEGRYVAYPLGVQLFLLMFSFWVRESLDTLKNS